MVNHDKQNNNSNGDSLIDVLRLIVGLQGVSMIQQGCNLTTSIYEEIVARIIGTSQGISNIFAGFLLVIIAIQPSLAQDILRVIVDRFSDK